MTVLYKASATAVGGRQGRVVSSDNVLDLDLKTPKELGGPGGYGTNPEQLFAAGYSACFDSALNLIIRTQKVKGVTATAVTATVSILKGADNGFKLAVELEVEIEGATKEVAYQLVEAAHQVCPYSNATRGNIEVSFKIV
ncbi:organic hydroperoxide resistance protein [Halalkalibacter akibai]|uniref:Organic hydroperoxide resistance protein n=1 Tax=Halalkalibacter akibai (strain ATCC 43226 / DSM 21942 / CIP 109018 / JCM 9157 / 1139) TaxID=1236973 RepID=W4QQ39_HALA3|nr:organic hydroperoxide resistance protein [Halalkalibacter akibai]GAE34027.1 organic hydroperoxide resistance protein [Halalkalibacter akibai JCM 9157]